MPLLVQGVTVVVGMALGLLAARLLIAGVLAATFGRGDRAAGAHPGGLIPISPSGPASLTPSSASAPRSV
jgi:hypothetical protein